MAEESENALLSRILFEARETADMHADIIQAESGRPVPNVRRLVEEIDAYRARRGWSPHGYGGEQ